MTTACLPKELRGNKLIGQVLDITDPDDGAFGYPPTPRTCGLCFFREGDCIIANKNPKKDFGIAPTERMSQKIDNIEIGFYCRSWTLFDCE